MARPGFLAAPPRFTTAWKPLKAKTTPEVVTAVRTAVQPFGAKPPCAVKFPVWKPEAIRATTARTGIANLTRVSAALILARSWTDQ